MYIIEKQKANNKQLPTQAYQSTMSTTSQNILSPASFNPSTCVKYAKPKVNSSGGKSIGILNAASGTVLQISSPMMLTWGVNQFVDEKTGKISYDMSLQFPDEDRYDDNIRKFFNNIRELEQKVKEDAIANSKDWFGRPKMSAETTDALFTPMLKYPKDKSSLETDYGRAPTFKIKLPCWEGVWKNIDLYDMDRRLMFPVPTNPSLSPSDFIQKGSQIAVGIQCGGIWFAGGKFGVTWNLIQGLIKPKLSYRGTCGIELPGEAPGLAAAPAPAPAPVFAKAPEPECDDDDEEEEEEDAPIARTASAPVVPKPAPVAAVAAEEPASKKKIVRKVPVAAVN
jgi:hypothetical protein